MLLLQVQLFVQMCKGNAVWDSGSGWRSGGICKASTELSFIHRRLMSAEVRVPLADTTVMKAPEEIAESALVLMADIFPTGYFAANNAIKNMTREQISDATLVLIGCG